MSLLYTTRIVKSITITACLLFIVLFGYGQTNTSTIHGIIRTADGKPASYIPVALKGTNKGAVTDEQGTYLIKGIEPGTYTLVVKSIGWLTQEKQVSLSPGQQLKMDLPLLKDAHSLQEITVIAGYNKFAQKEVEDVARMPLKNLENPQVYNVIPKELLQDQLIVSYNDVLKNVTGVSQALVNGSNSFNLRGFFTTSYLRNGLQDFKTNSIELANIERIEVLKGPSATLFGSSLISFGGLLNRVSKKPLDTFNGEVAYTVGGFGLHRVTADVNTPLSKEKGLFLRTNAAYDQSGSFQDAGFSKRFFLAPSLLYKPNSRLSVLLDAEIYAQKANDFNRMFPEASFTKPTPRDLGVDWKKSYSDNSLYETKPSFTIYGEINYKLSDKWTSKTSFSRTHSREKGNYSWNNIQGDTVVSRNPGYEDNIVRYTQVQQNFNGDFSIAGMRNRIVVGLDYTNNLENLSGAVIYGFDQIRIYQQDPHYYDLTKNTLDAALANVPFDRSSTRQITYSAYVSDVLNITDNLLAMASVRVDHFVSNGNKDLVKDTTTGKYNQTAVSPKFGLVYQVLPSRISLFANYMNGFSNNAPARQPDNSFSSFKPSHANQWETGIKMNAFKGKLNSTISYYHIKVDDMIRNDRTPGREMFQVQDGGQLSKGVEVEIIANPFKGFNLIAGYAYNDVYTINTNPDVDGLRQWTGPGQTANLWLSYHVLSGVLKGIGLGFGGNYSDKAYIEQSRSRGAFYMPAYTVFNALTSYERSRYRVTLKLDNLTNEVYWGSYVGQMMPRRFSASIAAKF